MATTMNRDPQTSRHNLSPYRRSVQGSMNLTQNQLQNDNLQSSSEERTLSKRYESLDYDLIENVLYLEQQHKSKFKHFLSVDIQRWIVILLIGVFTALSGFFAVYSVNTLTNLKFGHIITLSERCRPSNETNIPLTTVEQLKCFSVPALIWILWSIVPAGLGSILVTYLAPIAAGSGIPVVKCYLNGVKVPEVVRFKTYLSKLVGVVLSVVGGLAVGKEGPFIHCGAAIAAGLSQGKSTTFNTDLNIFRAFRNDRDKRDFVSAGASAGVSAAFGSPIGGVLFSLEEGASFWNQALTWRMFFCSMMTSFILNLMMSAYNHSYGMLAFYSLVNFGLVEELDYFWFEIPIYLAMAVVGGLIGALYCFINLEMTKFRKRHITENWMKVCDTMAVATLTALLGCLLVMFAADCRPLPPANNDVMSSTMRNNATFEIFSHPTKSFNDIGQSGMVTFVKKLSGFTANNNKYYRGNNNNNNNNNKSPIIMRDIGHESRKALDGHILTFMCPPGQYSAMSSLWLKTSEGASSAFMVLQDDIWSIQTLAIFFVIYFVLAVSTYGLSISSGLFIPALLIGATGGRLLGLILKFYLGPREWLMQPNKFALIGAVSVLGGVVRMTISLTVIIIEATGCISFGLPIMLSLMVSKWVADYFIEGLYDLAIQFANIPFLESEPPIKSCTIYASDVMSHNVTVLKTTETVANIVNILRTQSHNGFPVVDYNENQDSFDESGDFVPSNNTTGECQSSGSHQSLVSGSIGSTPEHAYMGSFQRCSVTQKRVSHGRYRGLILRWQLTVLLDLKIFNENERGLDRFNLATFRDSYPRYPNIDQVISSLTEDMYKWSIDLRSIMNPTAYTVLYSATLPRIYQLFRSLGLRHLVVTDDRNNVVGMVTRKDLARYVSKRHEDGFTFQELRYSG